MDCSECDGCLDRENEESVVLTTVVHNAMQQFSSLGRKVGQHPDAPEEGANQRCRTAEEGATTVVTDTGSCEFAASLHLYAFTPRPQDTHSRNRGQDLPFQRRMLSATDSCSSHSWGF